MLYGFITYGGPVAHIAMLQKQFVNNLKCQQEFIQIIAICQSIPGPTSTQMIIFIGSLTSGTLGGIFAFILFSFPTFIVLMLSGVYIRQNVNYQIYSNNYINYFLNGCQSAVISVILQSFITYSNKYWKNQLQLSIIVFTATIFTFIHHCNYYLPEVLMIMFLFLGGIVIMYKGNIEQEKKKYHFKKLKFSFLFGKFSVITLFVLFIILWISANVLGHKIMIYCSIFYRIGTIIIGGGYVIIPIMYSSLNPYNYFKSYNFWNGLILVNLLPGPMFNISAYIGSLIDGYRGAILCYIFLYIPAFLFIWAILPFYKRYRKSQKINKFIKGVCCVSMGLILSSAIMLFMQISKREDDYVTTFMITLQCLMILYLYKIPIPFMIILGGVQYCLRYYKLNTKQIK